MNTVTIELETFDDMREKERQLNKKIAEIERALRNVYNTTVDKLIGESDRIEEINNKQKMREYLRTGL